MLAQPRIPTIEEKKHYKKRLALYDYYGIPYLEFDDSRPDAGQSQKEKDWNEASLLIMADKKIPEDLRRRLLAYKTELEKNLKNKELLRNNLCKLRRIFLRECQSKIRRIAGYVTDFWLVLSEKKTSKLYKLFLNSS